MSRYGLGTFLRHFFISRGYRNHARYNLGGIRKSSEMTPRAFFRVCLTMLARLLLLASASAAGATSSIAPARSARASTFFSSSSSSTRPTSASSSTPTWATSSRSIFLVDHFRTGFRQPEDAFDGTFSDGGEQDGHERSNDVLLARLGPLGGRHGGHEGRHEPIDMAVSTPFLFGSVTDTATVASDVGYTFEFDDYIPGWDHLSEGWRQRLELIIRPAAGVHTRVQRGEGPGSSCQRPGCGCRGWAGGFRRGLP